MTHQSRKQKANSILFNKLTARLVPCEGRAPVERPAACPLCEGKLSWSDHMNPTHMNSDDYIMYIHF